MLGNIPLYTGQRHAAAVPEAARSGRRRVHIHARPGRLVHAAAELFKPPAAYDHKLMTKQKSNLYSIQFEPETTLKNVQK